MNILRGSTAAVAAVALSLTAGMVVTAPAAVADETNVVNVTPNPWFANGPFEGWGTSLAWFANATGSYGEPGSITQSSGDSAADAKALAYGKQLREQFYQSIFGQDGLDLNMARYNVGGGNASDVAYGYPFMRQGAAVPGTWKDDAQGSGVYGQGITTKQADKDALDAAFDPTDDAQYDFSKSASQDWWVKRGAETGDITDWEAFANSAPWFMTNSGYATGGYDASQNNLKDPQKFAQYLAKNVEHLEKSYGINVNTVEPLNESETKYWSTPNTMAGTVEQSGSQNDKDLIGRYANRSYSDKDLSVTPYSTALKKPQEGMAVSRDQQIPLINALNEALKGNANTVVSSTDASVQSQFVTSYNNWLSTDPSIVSDKKVGQYNVHSYGSDAPRQVRDIAQGDATRLSMSEVDGDFSGQSGFNPYNFSNATGMAQKINSDVYNLQSQDWTFWQVVEDLYNMSTPSNSSNNPKGENLNWGTVFIDFDCTVAGKDGKLYSERRVDNNGGTTDGLSACNVLANSKYNAVRAYTKFIQKGDAIIANNATGSNMTATSADGKTQTVVHTNASDKPQTLVIDLSKYGSIADNASGKLFLTTAPAQHDDAYAATLDYMNAYSNVEQGAGSVVIDRQAKTATVTVPGNAIASIRLSGVTGVSDDAAAVKDGQTYQLLGKQSGKMLADAASGDSALSLASSATNAQEASKQVWKFTAVNVSSTNRPSLRKYVIQNAEGKVLVAKNGTAALSDETLDAAKSDPAAGWIFNTENGAEWQLTNAGAKQSLDVNGSATAVGTKVGLWTSSGSDNQTWTLRDTTSSGIRSVSVQTPIGVMPTNLPETVVPYYRWGAGTSTAVTWNTGSLAGQISKAGTYQIDGTATDVYGNALSVHAQVVVGAFSVTDPASMTVSAGTKLADVTTQAPTQVDAHVGVSDAFARDVSWRWDGVSDDDFVTAGNTVSIKGSISAGDGTDATIPALLTVLVTKGRSVRGANVLASACTASASKSQTLYSSYPASLTCDGKLDTNWSNWGTNDTDAWLSYTFAKTKLHDMDFYVDAAKGEAAPDSFTIEYQDDNGDWATSDLANIAVNRSTGALTTADLSKVPETTGVRIRLVQHQPSDSSAPYAKVAEVRLYAETASPSPASDATLADLRADGATLDGFTAAKRSYTADLAGNAEAYPRVDAYATDAAAKVSIEQPSSLNTGKATITVTSADGGATNTYTVDFGALPVLAALRAAATTTTYRIGQHFDRAGLRVVAVYERDGKTSYEQDIAGDDPELSIVGFDSTVAGDKTITISYRGVSTVFKVSVRPDSASGTPASTVSMQGSSNAGHARERSLSTTGSGVAAMALVAMTLLASGAVAAFIRRRRQG